MKKITLALCTNRQVRPKTVGCLLDLVTHKGKTYFTEEIDFHILIATQGYTIAENRNYCVVQAQKNKSDYIFMVDDDMTFPPDTLERMLNRGKEVIGVNSYSRCLPLSSTVGLMDKKGEYMHPDKHTAWEMQIPDYLFEAYFVGTGIALIDMKVFKKIKKPYFEFTYDKNGQVIHGEDGNFCRKVKEAGIGVWCDGSIEVGHLGDMEYLRPKEEFNTFVPSDLVSNDSVVGSEAKSEDTNK